MRHASRLPVVASAELCWPACASDFLDPTRHFFVGEIDYTAPGAVEWYREQIISSVAMGFDGFMYDYGQAAAAARACSAHRTRLNQREGRRVHADGQRIQHGRNRA